MMDSRTVIVETEIEEALGDALRLAFGDGKANAWTVRDGALVLLWHFDGGKDVHQLPGAFGADELLPLVTSWLRVQGPPKPRPDIDGTVREGGFRLESGFECLGRGYGICSLRPVWATYHK